MDNFPPDRIFNMDETDLFTVPNRLHKVFTTKVKSAVNKTASAERRIHVTVVNTTLFIDSEIILGLLKMCIILK